MLKLIVAVDQNWGIGHDNNLLVSLPGDLAFFKNKTLNKIVIMGRKTLESLPNQQPLKNRINIVVTSDTTYKKDGCIIAHSLDEAINKAIEINEKKADIFIIGGESIYRQSLKYCDTCYVTKIDGSFLANKFFPNLDSSDGFIIDEVSEKNTENGIDYYFVKYIKK